MNNTVTKTQNFMRAATVDIVLLAVACLVPTLSHAFALPLYQLNPMLLVLLASMLLVSDRRNAFLMAVLLPVVSMITVGMPTPMKALCMVPEMLTIVAVSSLTLGKVSGYFGRMGCMVVAILCGKAVYYALKAVLIGGALVTTPWLMQALVVVLAAGLFAAFCKK